MRRTLLTIFSAAALAATLTACGSSGDGGTASKPGDCSPVDSTLTIGALDKLQFDTNAYDTGAGCVEITYENEGTVAHTLLVKGKSGFKLAVGKTDTGLLALEPGTYRLYCDIAGHESAGMHAELTVT